jgi:hypothetical protein
MTRWIWLLSAGCLIVGDPGDDPLTGDGILPIGEVHPCTVEIANTATAHWTVCFASEPHLGRFSREMMDGCAANGTSCVVQCSIATLHPCVLACPGTGISTGCNASHGCYCP